MRATRTAVLFSLLMATGALAGTNTSKTPTPAPAPAPAPAMAPTEAPIDPASVKPEDMPTAVRLRRLEQKTQALKERAWQLKARVQMLKEQMLGGGFGAQAYITHSNDMGSSFHLEQLAYSLDGTGMFTRSIETSDSLYKTKSFDVFSGPISPGNHSVNVVAVYRGHGYGVFDYLSKFTFTARSSTVFTVGEGKITKVECRGYEKGGANTPMEKRPVIDCKVTQAAPEKPAEAPKQSTPGSTPLPAPAASPTGK